jgi:hypothetical protein
MFTDVEVTDEERDALVEKWAQKIVGRGLEMPVVLFLEMHKPLSFLASQGLIITMPFLGAFVGPETIAKYSKLLEDRQNIERLIQRIEELAAEKSEEKRARKKAADVEGPL